MDNFIKTVTVNVKINFSATQWQLFSGMGRHADAAVYELNTTLEKSINEGKNREEIIEIMDDVMTRHADVGAADSEPDHFLSEVLDEVFGSK